MLQRARGRHLCDDCAAAAKAAAQQAASNYPQALQDVINAGVENVTPTSRLRVLETTITAGGGDVSARKAERYRAYLDQALADEVLTPTRSG
jgi:hypothetical protein